MRLIHVLSTFAVVVIAAICGGCTPTPEQARHTVEEYRADAELRREQLALCTNDPGTLGKTPDCINVKQAARRSQRSLRELPPVRLPKPNSEPSEGQEEAVR